MNGIVTKSIVNKRNKEVIDLNSFTRLPSIIIEEEERESNHHNFKEKQISTLKIYNGMYIYNQRLF